MCYLCPVYYIPTAIWCVELLNFWILRNIYLFLSSCLCPVGCPSFVGWKKNQNEYYVILKNSTIRHIPNCRTYAIHRTFESKKINIFFGQNLGFPATVERFSVRNFFFFVRCFFFQLVLILLLLLLFGYSRLTALASWVDWFSSHVQTKKNADQSLLRAQRGEIFCRRLFFCQQEKTWNSHHRVHLYLNTALVSSAGIRNLIV